MIICSGLNLFLWEGLYPKSIMEESCFCNWIFLLSLTDLMVNLIRDCHFCFPQASKTVLASSVLQGIMD